MGLEAADSQRVRLRDGGVRVGVDEERWGGGLQVLLKCSHAQKVMKTAH